MTLVCIFLLIVDLIELRRSYDSTAIIVGANLGEIKYWRHIVYLLRL